MSGDQMFTLFTLLLQAVFCLLMLWLKSTLTDLKNELVSIRTTLWEDTVRKSELAEVKKDIEALYSKANFRAEACAANHGVK